ncbi:Uncharacterised protein [Escherichia coli]|nr:Uncharacterised protein [Escherichia coli]VWM80486.1 Uncharacterised protein [Escherichia coli]
MHSWKKKLVVSQLALACTLAITSQANAATNDISGQTYNTFHHYIDWPPESPDNQYHLNK